MKPNKEELLLTNLNKAGFHVSINGDISDSPSEEWFTKNVSVTSSKSLTFIDFRGFWENANIEGDKLRYQADRKTSYPSIEDQLDMIYWDKINGTNKWKETIDLVKKKFPKD